MTFWMNIRMEMTGREIQWGEMVEGKREYRNELEVAKGCKNIDVLPCLFG